VKLTTAAPISEELKSSIMDRIRTACPAESRARRAGRCRIIGGFVLEIDGRMVDASIAYDLNNIRKQFQNNDLSIK